MCATGSYQRNLGDIGSWITREKARLKNRVKKSAPISVERPWEVRSLVRDSVRDS